MKRANFADAVKHGISSYSPFKYNSAKNAHEDDENKKNRFGPPKVNLSDRELDDIMNQTNFRVNTAASNGTFASSFGAQSPPASAINSPAIAQKHHKFSR